MSLWIAYAERTISEEIPAPPDAVREFYVDLDNIKDLHPLVVSVEILSDDKTTGGYAKTYRVRDRIPIGPLSMGITYRARVEVPTQGNVLTEARQFPRVRLNGTVSFEPTQRGTRLTERIMIAAPRPLAAITQRQAVDAHAAMLAGIRGHFENR
ncbi:polyketide cyclase / dehydrase and lipid transport [Mycobacterium sp. 1245111.1]|uniref:SRPBCC family protein n=1 Tax=Mycobacterium sp. 1245111.1 TaxID=1834073 RepID=UPI0007FF3C4E|nr:SRPBCC family protein [Mycobacterium sp. 1245111.1]OBK35538.1 polyketide cyclase / dehydrase and lipid transport [Mycobacterium sp. 1245111.1]